MTELFKESRIISIRESLSHSYTTGRVGDFLANKLFVKWKNLLFINRLMESERIYLREGDKKDVCYLMTG